MLYSSAPRKPAVLSAEQLWFPPAHQSTADGLVAVGGDLTPERLLLGYSRGLFPWYSEGTPILWWSPDPRCILPLDAVHVHKRLQRRLRQNVFRCTLNTAFEQVVQQCATSPRPGQKSTWILPEMRRAYVRLHQLGFAHSVECWQGEQLVGGVYGVALGRAFFGESMFHCVPDASKAALLWLVDRLREGGVTLFDCQQETPHMVRLGARMISRTEFLRRLDVALSPALDLGGKSLRSELKCTGELGRPQAANFG